MCCSQIRQRLTDAFDAGQGAGGDDIDVGPGDLGLFGGEHGPEVHLVADHQVRFPLIDESADVAEAPGGEYARKVCADHRKLMVEIRFDEPARRLPSGSRRRSPDRKIGVEPDDIVDDACLTAHTNTMSESVERTRDRTYGIRCPTSPAKETRTLLWRCTPIIVSGC